MMCWSVRSKRASIASAISRAGRSPILVSEPRVFALHGAAIAEALGADPDPRPGGRSGQGLGRSSICCSRRWPSARPTRDTPIIALGGGSVGDLAGLAAALFKRGCPIVHLPTTLLAQADSAIGGKTAIDAFGEKNLIGTFHQPALVDRRSRPSSTRSIARQLRAGYAEVVKYGLIDDPAFFAWCEANGRGLSSPATATCASRRSSPPSRPKARIVAGDVEDRSGKRALLNLGHSFGHAIEAEAGLGTILHGEAVALGMALAFRFSAEARPLPRRRRRPSCRRISRPAACRPGWPRSGSPGAAASWSIG